MRYMLLIYTNEDERARASAEFKEQVKQAHWAVMEETRRLGILQGA